MTTEENKEVVRQAIEAIRREGGLDLADEVIAPDFVSCHPVSSPKPACRRLEGLR